MYAYIIVFLGAGIGGALRHGANVELARKGMAALVLCPLTWGQEPSNISIDEG